MEIKDSGKREQYDSGMVRDTAEGKTDYSLVLDGPMFLRWAEHLTNGAKKYAKRNWMNARGQAEKDRFKESALRHFIQWYNGEDDEDHASAVFFNINGAEYVGQQGSPKGSPSGYKPGAIFTASGQQLLGSSHLPWKTLFYDNL